MAAPITQAPTDTAFFPVAPRNGTATQERKPMTSLAAITKTGAGLPNRYGIYAVEKWGKTSLAAHFPNVVFVQTKGETGLDPLIDSGLVPEVAHFPECQTWEEFIGCLQALLTEPHEYKVLPLDTLNGAERLCHEFVCKRDFGGDWSDKGFASYQKGPEVALSEWRIMLALLDRLRVERRMTIICLMHTATKNYKNPAGADYDKWLPAMDHRTWGLTSKWLDVILFGNFYDAVSNIKENKKTGEVKGKGQGGTERVLYAQGCAAFTAGNRLGLSPEIDMGSTAAEACRNLIAELRAARERNRAAAGLTTNTTTQESNTNG